MSNLPVSVVVPARNAAHGLGECLESIGRRYPHKVIVIGFDGLRFGLASEPGHPGHGGSAPARRAGFLLALATGIVLLLAGCLIQGYYGLCRAQGRLVDSTAVAVVTAVRRPFLLTR